MNLRRIALLGALVAITGCAAAGQQTGTATFGDDVAFLEKHTRVIILKDGSGQGQVAVLPAMQGRVMTSTAAGLGGYSFGWINRDLIASGKVLEHMNAYGGEDRFWLGPEGGQFSIFFEKGAPFELEHWYTPAAIDTEPWDVTHESAGAAAFRKTINLKNYSGEEFRLRADRMVRVLERNDAVARLAVTVGPDVNMVAFESSNRITNIGESPWRKETGLLSIWILGMFRPSPETTVVIPFRAGPDDQLGPVVNDAYFGKVPSDRLVIDDGVLFFSGDGRYRSKIGLAPLRAKEVLGSYDALNGVLTIVQYNKPTASLDYVNSMWEIQEHPYRGDVVNSYNDGPPAPGAKPMGPFYELETSSPAAALSWSQSLLHTHRTFHFAGTEAQLDPIAEATLGVTIARIKSALP